MASVQGFDERILQFLDDHRRLWLDRLADGAMGLGEPVPTALIGVVVIGVLILTRRWRLAVAVPLAAIAALTAARIGKELVGRDRPPVRLATVYADGSAFPSTSATLTMAVMFTVFLLAGLPSAGLRRWAIGLACAAPVLLSAWAVMYLGAHWPTDVLAGWMLGAVAAVLASVAAILVVGICTWMLSRGLFEPMADTTSRATARPSREAAPSPLPEARD